MFASIIGFGQENARNKFVLEVELITRSYFPNSGEIGSHLRPYKNKGYSRFALSPFSEKISLKK